ncbi:mediator complex subunit [Steccherinum ochraceum]|uniref:Mediator of RNA polymerase II transcription subunit 5 n=1 Tax=Steccherinum ochraceum TaxID=92696 RepID=A0A4R0R5V9_9APHY|nr:mediator complex subunit [Steccherinum ochraceum]
MASPDRQELIRNAVVFLADPKIQSSPLAQRVQFLEAKGLTAPEIEEAMRQSTYNQSLNVAHVQQHAPQYGAGYGPPMPYAAQPPNQVWDWRDYFITAVVSGAITYGAVSLFRKYISPHLRPPSATAYEEDKDALTAQFDAAEALLKEIQADTAAVRLAVEEQKTRVDQTTQEVDAIVKEMRDGEAKTRDEMREIREEINNVREMLPKMMEKSRENQTQSLAELQQELKSLKALLLSRGPTGNSGFTTPVLPSKPSIPSWQLSAPSTPSPSASLSSASIPTVPGIPAPIAFGQPSSQLNVSLTDATISNLKKSLASQRPGSPVQAKTPTSEQPPGRSPGHRTTLEDRLRAKFAIGDVSASTSPNASSKPSRSSTPVTDHPLSPSPSPRPQSPDVKANFVHPLSPTSTPLPDSPQLTAINDIPNIPTSDRTTSSSSTGGSSKATEDVSSAEVSTTLEAVPPMEHIAELDSGDKAVAVDTVVTASEKESDERDELEVATLEESPQEPAHGDEEVPAVAEPSKPPEKSAPSDEEYALSQPSQSPVQPSTPTENQDQEPEHDHSPTSSQVEAPTRTSTTVLPYVDQPPSSQSTEAVAEQVATLPVVEVAVPEAEHSSSPIPPLSPRPDEADIEALQQRLKLVEQRFTDVSTSFKRLQAEKAAADRILRELTPLESIHDADALSDYFQNMNLKNEMAQDEIRRLTGKLTRQEERIEELRDTHKLESKSQSDQIERLRAQIEETETLLKASQAAQLEATELAGKRTAEMETLRSEAENAKSTAKEEEEKRTKAIALLKTVRQKLVKAEKERDDTTKELHAWKDKEKEERAKEHEEKQRLHGEIEKVNHERDTAIAGLRAQFDKEVAGLKERHEKELLALRGQYELEAVTTKATFTKELEVKTSRASQLETSVQSLRAEKDDLFDQLQMRQAELESSRHLQETLQSQSSEYQYQIRESTERIALLQDELADAQRSYALGSQPPGTPADDVSKLLHNAEMKYETRLAEMRRQLTTVERERDEGEVEWSRKLNDKLKEIERLKLTVSESLRSGDDEKERTGSLKDEIKRLQEELRLSQGVIAELRGQAGKIVDVEATTRSQLADATARTSALQQQLEEAKNRETQLRTNNKTLRDELRKVQSSAALLERQRNPGVGYWAAKNENGADARSPRSSVSDLPSHNGQSSRPGSPVPSTSDEEVNFEYLRNVILQFLEHKEMRSGITANKWLKLCKLFISQNLTSHAVPDAVIHRELSNSVLVLYRSYPGDPALQTYLKASIQDGLLPLSAFVAAFLSGARSPDLHNASTLDSLCRVIVESHFASGMPPMGSVVPFTASISDILETTQYAMNLLRTAYSLPSSNAHNLVTSASALLLSLINCLPPHELSHISTTQAVMHFADANELLQLRLSPDVRQALENFALSLSLLLGDDAKAAREAQMMHTLQLALGKGDVIGPNSDTDISSCGLLLHSLISRRGNAYGSGDTSHATALLVAYLRWSSWSPGIFYTQLLIAAMHGLSDSAGAGRNSDSIPASLWRAFVIGRLPQLLSAFEKAVEQDGAEPDWRTAMHLAISTLHHRADLVQRCDIIHFGISAEPSLADGPKTSPFMAELLRQLLANGLIDQSFVTTINSTLQSEPSRIQAEAQDASTDMELYIDSKLASESNMNDIETFMGRVWKDPFSHKSCASAIRKRFTTTVSSLDIDALGHLCKILCTVESALDILTLHHDLVELLAMALRLVEDYDCETVGDPQTAVAHLGDVVLFLQSALARFHLSSTVFRIKDRELRTDVLSAGSITHRIDQKGEDTLVFNAWFKALFDSNSEGIDDTILRSTKPKVLLRIAGTLFSHAIQQCVERKLDKETMNNGFSYFSGPLLNWTLIGVVKVLLGEYERGLMRIPYYPEVMQTLLTSTSCPRPVLRLTAGAILRLIPAKPTPGVNFDHTKIRRTALEALKQPTEDAPSNLTLDMADWTENPRRYLRNALNAARARKAPSLDIDQCLLYMAPTKFLQAAWAELVMAIAMGDVEIPRRLATFILCHPRPSSNAPPLLPVFMHVVLPSIVASLDHAPPTEQTMAVELLVAIISSALTAALNMEWALLSVCKEPRFVLGQSVPAMARRLGSDLRKSATSQTSTVIVQRLASSQSFITNFPTFMAAEG